MKTDMEVIEESIEAWAIGGLIALGVWAFVKAVVESGAPDDPKINQAKKMYLKKIETCKRLFPHSGSSATIPTGNRKEDGSFDSISVDTFKENPKQGICILNARYEFSKFIVNYLNKTSADKICSQYDDREKNKRNCLSIIKRQHNEAKAMLADAKQELDMLKKFGQDEKGTQWNVKVGRLKHLN